MKEIELIELESTEGTGLVRGMVFVHSDELGEMFGGILGIIEEVRTGDEKECDNDGDYEIVAKLHPSREQLELIHSHKGYENFDCSEVIINEFCIIGYEEYIN